MLKPPQPPEPYRRMDDEEFRALMKEAMDMVVTGPPATPIRSTVACIDNQSHFIGTPCKRCGGTRRYFSNRACVACVTKKNRETSNPAVRDRYRREMGKGR